MGRQSDWLRVIPPSNRVSHEQPIATAANETNCCPMPTRDRAPERRGRTKPRVGRAAVKVGAVDIGTNSMRLLLAEGGPSGAVEMVRVAEVTGLGVGVDLTGLLGKLVTND